MMTPSEKKRMMTLELFVTRVLCELAELGLVERMDEYSRLMEVTSKPV